MDDATDEREGNVKLLGFLLLGILVTIFGLVIQGPNTFFGGLVLFLICLAELFRRVFFSMGRAGPFILVGIIGSGIAYGSYAFLSTKKEALRTTGLEWRKNFDVQSVDIGSDGNIWFVGYGYKDKTTYGRIAPNGKILFRKKIRTLDNDLLRMNSIKSLDDGGAFFMGRGDDENGLNNGVIFRVNTEGDIIWKHSYGEQPEKRTMDNFSQIYSAVSLNGGGAIIVGRDRAYPYAARINPGGDIVWEQTYDDFGEGALYDIALRSPDRFITVGGIQVPGLKEEAYARLMNVDGEEEAAFYWGGEKNDKATALYVSEDGLVLIGAQRGALGDNWGGDIVLSRLRDDEPEQDEIGRY